MFLGVIPDTSDVRSMSLSGNRQTADKTERKVLLSLRFPTRTKHSRIYPTAQIQPCRTHVASNSMASCERHWIRNR